MGKKITHKVPMCIYVAVHQYTYKKEEDGAFNKVLQV